MYNVNDSVLYAAQGVCTIKEIKPMQFGSETKPYYILKPINDESATIYVPKDSPLSREKMHEIISKEEIYKLIDEIPEENNWIENENDRKKRYKEIIDGADHAELLAMIKALYAHQKKQEEKGRKLHIADEHFFKEAERILYEEFALVLNIQEDEVLPFIKRQMHKDTPTA